MEPAAVRDLILRELHAEEFSHFGRPAYRIPPKKDGGKPGKTFATFWPEEGHFVLMLTKDQQVDLIDGHPRSFIPHPSKWGEKGATIMRPQELSPEAIKTALMTAYANATTAPSRSGS